MVETHYKLGDWNVICDFCGDKRKSVECRMTWDNFFVCADTCWQPRHPQDFVRAKADLQRVGIVRPDIIQSQGETTVLTAASKFDTTIDITSISSLADGDAIGITLDNLAIHWTYSDGTPAGNTVTLGAYMIDIAAVGNTVYIPSINNETFTTAT